MEICSAFFFPLSLILAALRLSTFMQSSILLKCAGKETIQLGMARATRQKTAKHAFGDVDLVAAATGYARASAILRATMG